MATVRPQRSSPKVPSGFCDSARYLRPRWTAVSSSGVISFARALFEAAVVLLGSTSLSGSAAGAVAVFFRSVLLGSALAPLLWVLAVPEREAACR